MDSTEHTSVKPPRKRWTCCLILALCTAIPVLAVGLLWGWVIFIHRVLPKPPLVISKETTYITSPLTAEGHVDYFKAVEERFYPPELATDENGFRIFVRLFGDVGYDGKPEDREFYRLQKYAKLGLAPDIPPTLVLPLDPDRAIEEFYKAQGAEYRESHVPLPIQMGVTYSTEEITAILEQWEEERNRDGKTYRKGENNQWDQPWTLEEFPMLADWINEIDEPLDAIAEAIRKPVFFFPLLQSSESVESGKPQSLLEVRMSDAHLFRTVARLFQARATYRIGQGNIDGAIDDQLTLLRLGRHVTPKGPLVQYLVGLAIEGTARGIPVHANPEHPLTKQQIRLLLDGFDALPPRASSRDALEWERYMGLSAVQSVMLVENENILGFDIKITHPFAVTFDWNIIFRRVNEMYGAILEPSPRTKYYSILEAIEQTPTPWDKFVLAITPGSVEGAMGNMFIALLCPAVGAVEESRHRSECVENMQRLALAILLYQLEHEKMPDENWAEQIEKYLGGNALGNEAEQVFSCPARPAPSGKTTYALVQYGDTSGDIVADTLDRILLVELTEAVPFAEAVVSFDEVEELVRGRMVQERHYTRRVQAHPGGMNVAYQSGAVRFMTELQLSEMKERLRTVGQDEEAYQ